jgi:AAA domain (dynein-related subfamily)
MKNSALLVIAFYLSKFGSRSDPRAYTHLGFKNASESFSGLAEILEVPKNTVKNYCDIYDPLHGNRKGWHQKELQPRYKNVADALKDVDEVTLANICKKIVDDEIYRKSEAYLNDLKINKNEDFEDLSQLFLDLQSKSEAFDLEEIDQELPFEFQEKIRSACTSKYEISFSKYSVKLITRDSKNKLLVPNICFYMAIEGLPIFHATEVFNDAFKEIYQRLRSSGQTAEIKPEDLYTEMMKVSNSISIRKDFDAAALIYLKEIGKDSSLSLERFNKFINIKNWRLGGNGRDNAGKNPGRSDTSRSAILTALGVPHELMGSIYSLVEEFGKSGEDFSKFSILSGSYDSEIVDSPKNLIVYGAPGTGKSHYLNNLLKDANTIRTVFHSETQNSDFVGSLKPVTNSTGKVNYEFIAGPFIKAFVSAVKQPSKQIHLIIEEINRANAAAVFGEIFQLLDRDVTGRSEYEIQADELLSKYLKDTLDTAYNGLIYIPANLTINATMNSSDQGVYPLDSAFKRRWSFKYMPIDFQDSPKGAVDLDGRRITWEILAKSVNEILAREYAHLEEDRFIGPWFLNKNEVHSQFSKAIESKLFTYLWNDVLRHQQRDKIFNAQEITTFSDLIKIFNRQLQGDQVHVFSELVHEAIDRNIAESTPITDEAVIDSTDE